MLYLGLNNQQKALSYLMVCKVCACLDSAWIVLIDNYSEHLIFAVGVDMAKIPVQERNLGFVFQSYALFKHMNVSENVAFGLKMRKINVDIEARYVLDY